MKAAVVRAAGTIPVYRDFDLPVAQAGEELISVRASALSHFTKSRAQDSHYTAVGDFPLVAGADGVGLTQEGRRVYFVMPEAPFGALAEFCPVSARRCIELPASLDNVTAAAIANPGMSAWAALVERAHLVPGETVLVNGATGTAGRLAVQLAKHLGAGKVIATGRNVEELEEVKHLGADVVIPFTLGKLDEDTLKQVFPSGIDVVVDYLWGESAQAIIVAIAKSADDGVPIRFVHVGGASREVNIALPGAALRAAAIMLMGSGMGSVRPSALLKAISSVFDAVEPAGLRIATKVVPLSEVEQVWELTAGRPRLVFSIG
jgi:NADPH:quinone reductase-like Zn-dependent oxidoreductase